MLPGCHTREPLHTGAAYPLLLLRRMLAGRIAGGEGSGNIIAAGITVNIKNLTAEIEACGQLGLHGLGVDLLERNSPPVTKASARERVP